jgi:hypothetical protein
MSCRLAIHWLEFGQAADSLITADARGTRESTADLGGLQCAKDDLEHLLPIANLICTAGPTISGLRID